MIVKKFPGALRQGRFRARLSFRKQPDFPAKDSRQAVRWGAFESLQIQLKRVRQIRE
jgi:hypothetical protein